MKESISILVVDSESEQDLLRANVDHTNYQTVKQFVNEHREPVTICLLDRSGNIDGLFKFLNEHWNYGVLDGRVWRLWLEHGDEHFQIYNLLHSDCDLDQLEKFNYHVYDSNESYLENCHPDLWRGLTIANATHCFDYEKFYRDRSEVHVEANRIIEWWYDES